MAKKSKLPLLSLTLVTPALTATGNAALASVPKALMGAPSVQTEARAGAAERLKNELLGESLSVKLRIAGNRVPLMLVSENVKQNTLQSGPAPTVDCKGVQHTTTNTQLHVNKLNVNKVGNPNLHRLTSSGCGQTAMAGSGGCINASGTCNGAQQTANTVNAAITHNQGNLQNNNAASHTNTTQTKSGTGQH